MCRITEFKDWPKGLEVSYHDWVIRDSKTEIMGKLGFKPSYNRSGYKSHYQWKCSLDNGRYYFTIYDMSYGRKLEEAGLKIDHSETWKWFHENGVVEYIERMVKNNLIKNGKIS